MKTDIIIIGAGPGGYETAHYAAKNGLTVTIFETGELGGTCLNRGCIPTKVLCRNADVVNTLNVSEEFGIEKIAYSIDYAKMIERKDNVVSQLRDGVAMVLRHPNITLVRGEAVLTSSHTVICNEKNYDCDNMIIATGSVPKCLQVEGSHLDCVLTSDEILELKELPKSLCIIGGGVIGLEFASIFNSLGVNVTVVEYCKEVVPNFDSDLAKRLRQSLIKKGIIINVGAGVTSITEQEGGNAIVNYEQKGSVHLIECEKVLMAVGRKPRYPRGLDVAGITYTNKGITVDDNMCTNIANVYAIGDVNACCMLAHAAISQGKRVVNTILGREDSIRLDIMPSAIFTVPEAAMVGKSENSCKESGIEVIVRKAFFRANGKAVAMAEPEGMLKLIISSIDNTILGCHILGTHSSDIIHEISALMNKGATLKDLTDIIHVHPTLSEVVQDATM